MHDEDPLKIIERFHGHLGPYVAIGYRMGALARERLGAGKMRAVFLSKIQPPVSCAVDGIQLSSGCTMGKGQITVDDQGLVAADFTVGERKIRIRLKDAVKARVDAGMSHETERAYAAEMMAAPEEELFEVIP
ncbi:MAG: formylmethanofuran dehydrogenase subunit E family protein [Methanobacteriota archaeon]